LYAVAIAPSGEFIAAGGYGLSERSNPIYLIRLATGQIERVLKGHAGHLTDLAFSPDGTQLASVAMDGVARVWDAKTGQLLRAFTGAINAVAFSPDGRRLITGATGGFTARIWSLQTGQAEAALKDPIDGVNYSASKVAWSRDGKTCATVTYESYLRLWNTDGTLRQRVGPNAALGAQGGLSFTADGRDVLRANAFFDATSGKERVRFTQHLLGSYTNVLSADGTLAATGGWHGDELSIWRSADATLLTRLRGVSRTNWSAGWSSAGPTIAWGNTAKDASNLNPMNPLEKSFNLAELEFSGTPGNQFSRATTVRRPESETSAARGARECAGG